MCVVGSRVLVGRGWEMHVARMGRREMCAELCAENTRHNVRNWDDNIEVDFIYLSI